MNSSIIISLGEPVSVIRDETVDCEGTKVVVSNVYNVLNSFVYHYYRYIEIHVPQNRCSYYYPTGSHTTRHGVHPTDSCTWSMRVSEWLCQLHGDHPVHLLNNFCVCVPYTMPADSPLAVAVWSAGGFPGVACANNFPPKVAFNWNIRHCIFDDHEVLSESSIPGCTSGDYICPAILHAILWTRKNSELNLCSTANVYVIAPVHTYMYVCTIVSRRTIQGQNMPKRGVGVLSSASAFNHERAPMGGTRQGGVWVLFPVLPHLIMKEHPCHVYSNSIPSK